MLNYNEIGKKIRKERIKRNLTQDDLAEILFVTRQAISKWETGKSLPDQDVMLQLSNLFTISINDNTGYLKKYDWDISFDLDVFLEK